MNKTTSASLYFNHTVKDGDPWFTDPPAQSEFLWGVSNPLSFWSQPSLEDPSKSLASQNSVKLIKMILLENILGQI